MVVIGFPSACVPLCAELCCPLRDSRTCAKPYTCWARMHWGGPEFPLALFAFIISAYRECNVYYERFNDHTPTPPLAHNSSPIMVTCKNDKCNHSHTRPPIAGRLWKHGSSIVAHCICTRMYAKYIDIAHRWSTRKEKNVSRGK